MTPMNTSEQEPPEIDRIESRGAQICSGLVLAVLGVPFFILGINLLFFLNFERSIVLAILAGVTTYIGLQTVICSVRLLLNKPQPQGLFLSPWVIVIFGLIWSSVPLVWACGARVEGKAFPLAMYALSLFYFLSGGCAVLLGLKRMAQKHPV